MSHSNDDQKKRLRKYLNPTIRGKNTDSILDSLAPGISHLIHNVEAVNDMLYIVTAVNRYLDQLMAGRDIIRPDNVGLSDEVFRAIAGSIFAAHCRDRSNSLRVTGNGS